jgi:hypothetical protein
LVHPTAGTFPRYFIFQYMRHANFKYKAFMVEKKHVDDDPLKLNAWLSKQLSIFIKSNFIVEIGDRLL